LNISLETSLKLSQTLSPQMIQSLKLLQYSNLQLEQVIRQEMQQNPILEEVPSDEPVQEDPVQEEESREEPALAEEAAPEAPVADTPSSNDDEPAETAQSEDETDWEEYFDDGFDLGYRTTEEERVDEIYEKIPVNTASLEEHLLKQLQEKSLAPGQQAIGEFIIGNINDKGYLVVTPEDIASRFSTDVKHAEEVRHIIQNFDPQGVASLNLQECLLTQIRAKGMGSSLMAAIVSDHFELLKKYHLPEIARKLSVPVTEVQNAVHDLSKFEPSPGTLIGSGRPQVIIPDLIVNKLENGEFSITLNDGSVPIMRVSQPYLNLLKRERKKSPDVRKYLSEKLNAANWLLRSIEQRKITMIKVMTAIVDKQRTWFEKGPPNLKPLILQEIADQISMHISTVCRVTNGKYVQTPYGIFELKYFFSGGVDQDDGTEMSTSGAKDLIKEFIDNENKKRPLSDQKLVEMLQQRGIQVARRTISKYREQMNVLPARLRKEF